MKVEYHPLTVSDLTNAIAYYNQQRAGLGDEFRSEVYARQGEGVKSCNDAFQMMLGCYCRVNKSMQARKAEKGPGSINSINEQVEGSGLAMEHFRPDNGIRHD